MSKEKRYKYLHCGLCMNEIPQGISPQEYGELAVAVSPKGHLLIECKRHGVPVVHIKNKHIQAAMREIGGSVCDCGEGKPHTHSDRPAPVDKKKETLH